MEKLFEAEVRAEPSAGGEIAIVVARGEVDLANYDELVSALASPECERSGGVLLDLRELDFMDSSGLQAVLTAASSSAGRFAVLLTEGSAISSLFEIADLSGHIRFGFDESEARAAIMAPKADGSD